MGQNRVSLVRTFLKTSKEITSYIFIFKKNAYWIDPEIFAELKEFYG